MGLKFLTISFSQKYNNATKIPNICGRNSEKEVKKPLPADTRVQAGSKNI